MTKRKTVSIEIPELNLKKIFSIPVEWDDLKTVSKLVQAFDSFGDTDEGAQTIIKARFHSKKVRNSNVSIFGWDVLLEHTPKEFLESQSIHLPESPTDDVHAITLSEEEEELPMDDYRPYVVKTMDNYQIVKMYIEGERDEEGQEFYSKWSFVYQCEDDGLEGFVAYDIYPLDEEEGVVYPNVEKRFYSLEEAEAFVNSIAFTRTSENTFELKTSTRVFTGNESTKTVVMKELDGEVYKIDFKDFHKMIDRKHRNLINWN